jgi:hypothetical protein
MENETKELTARYDQDSKRFHRFAISSEDGITGSIYLPKGSTMPKKIILTLKTKADA